MLLKFVKYLTSRTIICRQFTSISERFEHLIRRCSVALCCLRRRSMMGQWSSKPTKSRTLWENHFSQYWPELLDLVQGVVDFLICKIFFKSFPNISVFHSTVLAMLSMHSITHPCMPSDISSGPYSSKMSYNDVWAVAQDREAVFRRQTSRIWLSSVPDLPMSKICTPVFKHAFSRCCRQITLWFMGTNGFAILGVHCIIFAELESDRLLLIPFAADTNKWRGRKSQKWIFEARSKHVSKRPS